MHPRQALHGTEAVASRSCEEGARYATQPRASRRRARAGPPTSRIFTALPATLESLLLSPLLADRKAKRAAKAEAKERAKKLAAPAPPPTEPEWDYIEGPWVALAGDGVGRHDGNGHYVLQIPVEDFAGQLPLGGDARLDDVNGDEEEGKIWKLPTVMPPAGKALTFHINICKEARGGIGRALLVGGVEVRAPSV